MQDSNYKSHVRFFKYAFVGAISGALYVGLNVTLSGFAGSASFAITAGSFVIATLFNYLLHYWLTFQSTQRHLKAASRFTVLVAVGALASGAVNMTLVHMGLSIFVSSIAFVVLWAVISYQLTARYVFQ